MYPSISSTIGTQTHTFNPFPPDPVLDYLVFRYMWILCDESKLVQSEDESGGTVNGMVKLQSEYLCGMGYKLLYINVSQLQKDPTTMENLKLSLNARSSDKVVEILSSASFRLSPRGVTVPCSIVDFLNS